MHPSPLKSESAGLVDYDDLHPKLHRLSEASPLGLPTRESNDSGVRVKLRWGLRWIIRPALRTRLGLGRSD